MFQKSPKTMHAVFPYVPSCPLPCPSVAQLCSLPYCKVRLEKMRNLSLIMSSA